MDQNSFLESFRAAAMIISADGDVLAQNKAADSFGDNVGHRIFSPSEFALNSGSGTVLIRLNGELLNSTVTALDNGCYIVLPSDRPSVVSDRRVDTAEEALAARIRNAAAIMSSAAQQGRLNPDLSGEPAFADVSRTLERACYSVLRETQHMMDYLQILRGRFQEKAVTLNVRMRLTELCRSVCAVLPIEYHFFRYTLPERNVYAKLIPEAFDRVILMLYTALVGQKKSSEVTFKAVIGKASFIIDIFSADAVTDPKDFILSDGTAAYSTASYTLPAAHALADYMGCILTSTGHGYRLVVPSSLSASGVFKSSPGYITDKFSVLYVELSSIGISRIG